MPTPSYVPDDVKAAREEALMLTQQAVCFDNMNYLCWKRPSV